jgi:hypothetical protein
MGVVAEFAPDYSSFTFIEGGPPMKLVRSKVTPPVTKPDGS